MARIKRAQIRRTRTNKLFKRSKGFFGARNNTRRQATEAVHKALAYKFRGRKEKKRLYRSIWIQRINAALGPVEGMNYSKFIHGLNKAGIGLNRKQLSELAIHDPAAFSEVVSAAKAALAG